MRASFGPKPIVGEATVRMAPCYGCNGCGACGKGLASEAVPVGACVVCGEALPASGVAHCPSCGAPVLRKRGSAGRGAVAGLPADLVEGEDCRHGDEPAYSGGRAGWE